MTRKPDPFRPHLVRRVPDGAQTLTVEVTYDRRLRSAAHFSLRQDTIWVRVPAHTSPDQLDILLDDIVGRVLKQRRRARELGDDVLEQRARDLNLKYFDSELSWHTIRWVSNMQRRLGSCSEGGTTDGDIRISDRIRTWPTYVVDYILAHELAHRKYADHSPAFWAYLARYPHTERAQGFIDGIAHVQGDDPDSLI